MKRHPKMILTESGRNLYIKDDLYTKYIPFAQWMFWILKKKNNTYTVLKVIK